jgi:hypothetical protein
MSRVLERAEERKVFKCNGFNFHRIVLMFDGVHRHKRKLDQFVGCLLNRLLQTITV